MLNIYPCTADVCIVFPTLYICDIEFSTKAARFGCTTVHEIRMSFDHLLCSPLDVTCRPPLSHAGFFDQHQHLALSPRPTITVHINISTGNS
jgi:hypothetical protein